MGEVATPVRTLSAAEVAKALGGRSKRIVNKWASEGLPHATTSGRGGKRRLFNLDEVREWLASKGLDPGTREESTAPLPFDAEPEPIDARELLVLDAEGRLDWDRIIANGTAKLFAILDGGRDPQAKQRLTAAFKNALGELRAIDEARHKAEERAGKFIERVRAEEIVVAEAVAFVSDLDALATDLPRRIVAELGDAGVELDPEISVRILSETVRRATDAIRRRRAEAIRKAVGRGIREEAAA